VLRRLVRRVLTHLWETQSSGSLHDLDDRVLEQSLELTGIRGDIHQLREILDTEERRFRGLLTRGRRVVERELHQGPLTEERLRYLHDTHGLPPEIVRNLVHTPQTSDSRY
jgi:alanyl-tRNA synthetase